MDTPSFHPLDYVSVLRRRMWWFIAPVVASVLVAAALALWLPREYRTNATLGVSLPALTPELLKQNGKVNPDERIRSITQTLYSNAVLERIVREEKLDKAMPLRQAVGMVRGQIVVELLKPAANQPVGLDTFNLAYAAATPDEAQRMTNKVADVFVEESSRTRAVRAEETSLFIGRQLESSQQRLSVLEGQLRTAKEAFMGALPQQTSANVAMVTGMQQQLETTGNAIRGEQDRLSMIERQVAGMKAGAANEVAVPGTLATASPWAVRVVQLERELEVNRGVYTEKHPEIVRIKDELAAARAAVEAEQKRPEEERVATLRVDPAYRGLLADAERARMRIRDLQRQEGVIRSQIAMYRARVDAAPRVEQQIATLQREYDIERDQYSDLMNRKRNAEIAENMERIRGGEQFMVLKSAGLPSEPFAPKPIRVWSITVLLGLVLGGALALGREYLDRAVHDARSLNDLDLPVLGEIPRIAQGA